MSSDPKCRPTENLPSSIKDLPQVRADKQTGKFEKDADIRSAQRRTNRQKEALPCSTGVKVGAAYIKKTGARETKCHHQTLK